LTVKVANEKKIINDDGAYAIGGGIEDSPYPWIGKSKGGIIVLFTDIDEGVVLGGDMIRFGECSKIWNEEAFETFDGTIELISQ